MSTHLVPDLDDELVWALVRVEELLLTLSAAENDPARPVRLPTVVSHGRALRALCRVYAALLPTQTGGDVPRLSSRPSGTPEPGAARTARRGPVWVGADGRRVLRPLALAELDPGDLTVLSRTATSMGYELALRPRGTLAQVLTAGAESVAELAGEAVTAVGLVESLARVLGLLDLAGTEDTAMLVHRLHRGAGREWLELTAEEEAAHRRTLDRMAEMWGAVPAAGS